MKSGVRFNTLERGEILINESINWTYKNLNGVYAADSKLNDAFFYANDIGFNYIFDKIIIKRDENNKLSLSNIGECSDVWPLVDGLIINNQQYDRMTTYKNNCQKYHFNFILEIEFSEKITINNIDEYTNFFIYLFKHKQFDWINNYQISEYPEQLIERNINGNIIYEDKFDPELYVSFISKIRLIAKSINSDISIGGPGLYKGCSYFNQSSYVDNSFDKNWIEKAMNFGLLNNIDFFSTQLIQNNNLLQYNNIKNISDNIKSEMNSRINRLLPIYSFNQGYQITDFTEDNYVNQSYYNTSELLNTAKNDIIPIIDKMIDPCDNTNINPYYNHNIDPNGYGILKFDLSKTYQYDILKFILSNLKDYNTLNTPNKLYEGEYANDITYISEDKSKLISIIFNNKNIKSNINIYPNVNEKLILINNEQTITQVYEFECNKDFAIIIQDLAYLQVVDIHDDLFQKFLYWSNYRDGLLNSIPRSYNTKIDDINFYQLIRAIAFEFADANICVDVIKDNTYLQSAHNEAIYNNFGSLVNLPKQAKWDYEKYRKLIQGVIKSLLTGPTLNSITDAMNLFINYNNIIDGSPKIVDITIHELYKQNDPFVNQSIVDLNGTYPDFAFVVEVDKNLDVNADMEEINQDLKFLINILKPARCISFVVVVLSGNEDYRDWYKNTHYDDNGNLLDFKDSDVLYEMSAEIGNLNTTDYYGWKHYSYNGIFNTFSNKSLQNSLLNSANVIAPKKTTHIKQFKNDIINYDEEVKLPELENPNLIRYGYYNDDKDGNEIKYDNQNLDKNSADYLNLDSGEYYKNWFVKFHNFINDNNNLNVKTYYSNTTNNMEENKSYSLISLNNFNKNIIEEQYNINKDIKIVNPPLFFTLSSNKINSVCITKKSIEVERTQYEIENSNFSDNKVNYYYSHIGTSSILHPEKYFNKGYKYFKNNIFQLNNDKLYSNIDDINNVNGVTLENINFHDVVSQDIINNKNLMKQIFYDCTDYEIELLQKRLLLYYELRVYNYQNKINNDGTINTDNGLYNILYLQNGNIYNGKNFAFFDMDIMPNFKVELETPKIYYNWNIFQLNKDIMYNDINKIINTTGFGCKFDDKIYNISQTTNFSDIHTKQITDVITKDFILKFEDKRTKNIVDELTDFNQISNYIEPDDIKLTNNICKVNDEIFNNIINNKSDIKYKNIIDAYNFNNNKNYTDLINNINDVLFNETINNKNDNINKDIVDINVFNNDKLLNDKTNNINDELTNKERDISYNDNIDKSKDEIYTDVINNNKAIKNQIIDTIFNDVTNNYSDKNNKNIIDTNVSNNKLSSYNDKVNKSKEKILTEVTNNNKAIKNQIIDTIFNDVTINRSDIKELHPNYKIYQLNNMVLTTNINNLVDLIGIGGVTDEFVTREVEPV